MNMPLIDRLFTRTSTAGAVTTLGTAETPLTPEQRRDRINTALKWSLGLGVAVVVSPVIFLAIKGGVGLAIAGVLGLLGTQGAPVLSFQVANWRTRALRTAAQAHPLDTLERHLVDEQRALNNKRRATRAFLASMASRIDFARDAAGKSPDKAAYWQREIARAEQASAAARAGLKVSAATVQEFESQVTTARAEYHMSEAYREMDNAGTLGADDPQTRWLVNTAFDEVRNRVSQAFVVLDDALAVEVPAVGAPPKSRAEQSDLD